VISGETLMFSGFVDNRLEYYRNVLLLIILKGTFPHVIYRPWFMYIMYQATLVTYINNCPQISSYILKPTSNFPPPFATNLSYTFHISLNPQFPTQFAHHTRSNVFDQSIHISVVFQNRAFDLLCLSCRLWIFYTCFKLQ